MAFVIPVIFISVILIAALKKVSVFSSFTRGAKDGLEFTLTLIPLLAAIFMMCELFEVSGLSSAMSKALSPVFGFLGIPEELSKLILIKPFSGSGSLSYLTGIIECYGADSYIGRCACVLYGSSETVFYISAVYFANTKKGKRIVPIIIILFSTFISTIFACFICRFI
ncbi:MAG: nucleoside recognition domain-containing protein [Candidatus Coproplasma sp.]